MHSVKLWTLFLHHSSAVDGHAWQWRCVPCWKCENASPPAGTTPICMKDPGCDAETDGWHSRVAQCVQGIR